MTSYRVIDAVRGMHVPSAMFDHVPESANGTVGLYDQSVHLKDIWAETMAGLSPAQWPLVDGFDTLMNDVTTLMLLGDHQDGPKQLDFLHWMSEEAFPRYDVREGGYDYPLMEKLPQAFASRVAGDRIRMPARMVMLRAVCEDAGLNVDDLRYLMEGCEAYLGVEGNVPRGDVPPAIKDMDAKLRDYICDEIGGLKYFANRHGNYVRYVNPNGNSRGALKQKEVVHDSAVDAMLHWLVADVVGMNEAVAQHDAAYPKAQMDQTLIHRYHKKDDGLFLLFGFENRADFLNQGNADITSYDNSDGGHFFEHYMTLKHAWQRLLPVYMGEHEAYADGALRANVVESHPVLAPLVKMMTETINNAKSGLDQDIKAGVQALENASSPEEKCELAQHVRHLRQERSYWGFQLKATLRPGVVRTYKHMTDEHIVGDSKGEALWLQMMEYFYDDTLIQYGDIRDAEAGQLITHAMGKGRFDGMVRLSKKEGEPEFIAFEYHPHSWNKYRSAAGDVQIKMRDVARDDGLERDDYYMVAGTESLDPEDMFVQAIELVRKTGDERIVDAVFPKGAVERCEQRLRENFWAMHLPPQWVDELINRLNGGSLTAEMIAEAFEAGVQRHEVDALAPHSLDADAHVLEAMDEQVRAAMERALVMPKDEHPIDVMGKEESRAAARRIMPRLAGDALVPVLPEPDALQEVLILFERLQLVRQLSELVHEKQCWKTAKGAGDCAALLVDLRELAEEHLAVNNEAFRHWNYEDVLPTGIDTEAGAVTPEPLIDAMRDTAENHGQGAKWPKL